MSDIISTKVKAGKEITEEEIERNVPLIALKIYKVLIYEGYYFRKDQRIFRKLTLFDTQI